MISQNLTLEQMEYKKMNNQLGFQDAIKGRL